MKKISRRNFLKAALTSGIVLGSGNLFAGCNEISRNVENNLHSLEKKLTGDLDIIFCDKL